MEATILGGNGYIGREVCRQWIERDPQVHITVISRSGKNELSDSHITNISCDADDADVLVAALPNGIEAILCLVGGLGGEDVNVASVQAMLKVAEKLDIPMVGCIGGTLGDKDFTAAKAKACELVRNCGHHAVIVEPTLVYGAGRSDKLAKMVPFLKFVGAFNKNMRPMRIEDVAAEFVSGFTEQ